MLRKLSNHIIALIFCSLTPTLLVDLYFLIGAFFTSSTESLGKQLLSISMFITFVAAAHAVIIGLPIYILIKNYMAFTYKVAALSGFFVGFIPIAIFTWPLKYAGSNSSASHNGVQTLVNGVPTMAGWLSYLQGAVIFGLLGLVSALVYNYFLSVQEHPNKPFK
jgi:hypothetical protein